MLDSKICNFFKNRLQRRCSHVFPLEKSFKNSPKFLIEHLWWLLLPVLQQYSKVSRGLGSLVLSLNMLPIFIKLHEILDKCFFPIMWQNNFFLAWVDWSRALDFRICFGKTFIGFHFDEKT